MSRLSAIVPVLDLGPPPERCVAALARDSPGLEIRTSPADPASLNAAVASTGGEALLFVPSFVRPLPGLASSLLAGLERKDAGLAYGDYEIVTPEGERVRRCMVAERDDLSEWSSTGYVAAVRREAFDAVGGYDPTFDAAAEYDLRLRLSRRWSLARSEGARYAIDAADVAFVETAVKDRLRRWFTPESSPRTGLGYLHGTDAARSEIERAFRAELAARGARLPSRPEPLECPHGEASPRVTVAIPVHDRAALVVRAIESVLDGAYDDFEILVVDGGSTDGTVEAVAALARERPEVRLLHAPGNRIAGSMNVAVREARGAYLARLDSDDLYEPETLKRMVAHLDAHPDEALAVSWYDFIDTEGRPIPSLGVVRHPEYDRDAILRTSGAGAVRVWHRCALERLGGFDEENCGHYAEDYDMVLRVSERWAVGRVPETLYRCRLHGGNTHERLDLETRARVKAGARRRALRRRTNGPMDPIPDEEAEAVPSPEPARSIPAAEGARRRFDFYGCTVEATSRDPSLVDEVRRDFLYFDDPTGPAPPSIRVEMRLEPPDYSGLPAVPATVVTPRNVCFRDGSVTYLDYFGRALGIHDAESGRFTIAGTDRHLVHEATYLFLLSTVGQHLDRIGLHRIHALGMRHRGGAVLLLLPSGGGKSTFALELLRRPGFELLSEDTPLMDRRGRLRPFPLRLGVRPGSDLDVPERHLRTVRRMEFDPKTLIDIDYFADRLCEPDAVVEPRLVLVGERSLGAFPSIEPMSRARALGAFVKYGVVGLGVYQGLEFLLERGLWELAGRSGTATSRLWASARLLARAPARRFVLGRDVERNTRRLLEHLESDG